MKIKYLHTKPIKKEALKALYEDAEWSGYTNDLEKLERAVINSDLVISAWEDEKLLGLIRTISDRETILYIQDILVLKKYKQKGIGKELMKKALNNYSEIRQIVLMTDAKDIASNFFYEKIGFKATSNDETIVYMKK